MGIVECSELSGAAIQVDETWAKSWEEPEAVINCNDTNLRSDFIKKKKSVTSNIKNYAPIIEIISFATTQHIN